MTQTRPPIVVCTKTHDLPNGHVSFLGAAESVTPAMSLVELDGITLLVDCGADPGRDNKPVELPDEAGTKALVEALSGAAWRVTEVRERESKSRPTPPFTTSRLQQAASTRLGFSASRTMRIAQQLYEGVELPEGGSADLIWRLAKQHGIQIRHLAPATVSLEQAFEKAVTEKAGGVA